jgi:hypothetical protein
MLADKHIVTHKHNYVLDIFLVVSRNSVGTEIPESYPLKAN